MATERRGKHKGEVVFISKCPFLSHIFSLKITETNYTVSDRTTECGGRAEGRGNSGNETREAPSFWIIVWTGTRGLEAASQSSKQSPRQAGRQAPGAGRRSYIKRGLKWEEEGGHKEGSREEGSGGNGRGSKRLSVHGMNERTMFGHGGFALPVCCSLLPLLLLLHLLWLPHSCGWSLKVTRLPRLSLSGCPGVGSISPCELFSRGG